MRLHLGDTLCFDDKGFSNGVTAASSDFGTRFTSAQVADHSWPSHTPLAGRIDGSSPPSFLKFDDTEQ